MAIGDVPNLVISTYACKGLETAVGAVFPQAENRECMRHLYQNFMKHYSGDVFTANLYFAARSYTQGMFQWHKRIFLSLLPLQLNTLNNTTIGSGTGVDFHKTASVTT